MSRGHDPPRFTDLFDQDSAADRDAERQDYPPAERFPLNIPHRQTVQRTVQLTDLYGSKHPFIVTGYASLDRIVAFICEASAQRQDAQVRLLFGHEPFPSRALRVRARSLDLVQEAEEYWLERGISLLHSAHIVRSVELLKSGQVQARYMPGGTRLHAKIYIGDDAATLGSSNFTDPGMQYQFEANARFSRARERARYAETVAVAENYWRLGRDYNSALIALLEKLLQVVDWTEALARACAELLEGEWAERYLREDYLSQASSLWPSQKQGIAQALYVLSNQGSVLIADATGAGKTRMGTYLVGALTDQVLRDGRMRRGKAAMICPPAVEEDWMRESNLAGVSMETLSQGVLSMSTSRRHDHVVDTLKRAQILCVDEGHNFLNAKSSRTQHLLRNIADHVVLLTATPINKGVADLVRIANLLGADNLAPEIVSAFEKMLGGRELKHSLSDEDAQELRSEIRKFTVRRTKRDLNALVDREPDAYRDKDGRQCRFPRHLAKIYSLGEPEQDRELAREIRSLAGELYAVTHFVRPIEMPDTLRRRGYTEKQFLEGRLRGAQKLAQYLIMSCLRSSRAAVIEHIRGTEAACAEFGIGGFSKQTESGNQLQKLRVIAGKLPRNKLAIELPAWLAREDEHRKACEYDLARYARIAELVEQMSDARERAKVELLSRLLDKHRSLLAFDSRPISLHYLKAQPRKGHGRVVVATGSDKKGKAEIMQDFAHGSEAEGLVGMCSDSLAEGVNLQQASALVHLDMPSVVRIAEQRAGRVDRLDSPHKQIELWWPDDAAEFALSSDERFVERYDTVEQLLGSNMPLPEHLQKSRADRPSVKSLIAEYEGADTWDGIDDAFGPARELVHGQSALVPVEVYEHYRRVQQRVLSRVSLVRAARPWAFFCLSAGSFGAPRWIYIPGMNGEPVTELAAVAALLRDCLSGEVESLPLDNASASVLQQLLSRLALVERRLLSRKKQRALEELELIVEKLLHYAADHRRQAEVEHLRELRSMLRNPPPDRQPNWDAVAAQWLDLIRPVWFEKLSVARSKPLLLKDIRKELLADKDGMIKKLQVHFARFPVLQSPEERIKACIIGVV